MKLAANLLYAAHIGSALAAGWGLAHREGGFFSVCLIGVVVFGFTERLVRERIWEAEL